MSTKQRTLDDYPCGNQSSKCRRWCRDMVDAGTAGCYCLPVYRQAIADHKCAWLLRVFEKRWLEELLDEWISPNEVHSPHPMTFYNRLDAFGHAIRDALRSAPEPRAGLPETEEG